MKIRFGFYFYYIHEGTFPINNHNFYFSNEIYAHQDKEDDLKVGIKSSAIYLGQKTKAYLVIFYSIAILSFLISGYLEKISWPFYLGTILAACILTFQVIKIRPSDPSNCLQKFKLNFWVGFFIFMGILGSRILNT